MDLRTLSPSYSVSPQITPEDIHELAGAGFKSVMCNRPDGEELGQPDFASIEAVAKAEGLEVRWVPIISGSVHQSDLDAFRTALEEMPRPMLAYCRSGTRCAMLWTITQYGTLPDADILSATQAAGYDMSGLLHQLHQHRG
ncbi:TIGR01244 family sulfur transferase [Roseovarius sp. 2305UL8-3]|uniref:TIGR01244 family sulfur transferase n=1 Tax=Roseovarius conchicola TaxID=3121636 RepID=UPI003526F8EE